MYMQVLEYICVQTHVDTMVWFSAHNESPQLPEPPSLGAPMPSSGFSIRHTQSAHIFLEAKHTHINFVTDNYSRTIYVILFTYVL